MNNTKKIILVAVLVVVSGFFVAKNISTNSDDPVGASVLFPYQGGTGVGTVPSSGQLLIGNSSGAYTVNSLTAGSNITLTPGSGTLSIAAAGGSPGGADTNVQFNDSSSFGGVASFTFDKTLAKLFVDGDASVSTNFEAIGYASLSNTLWVSPPGYSGNIGIGYSTPTQKVYILGTVTGTTGVNQWMKNLSSTGLTSLATINDTVGSFNQFITWGSAFAGNRKGVTAAGLNEFSSKGRLWIGTESNNNVYFGTNSSVKMTLLAGGNLGIGTESPTTKLDVIGAASVSTNFEVDNLASISKFSLTDSATGVTMVDCDGDTQAVGWDATNQRFFCGDDDTGAGGGVASDGLDFDEFVDAMTLDANTTVASGGFSLNFSNGGLGVKSGGTLNTPFEVGGIASISILYLPSGSAAAPSLAFLGDTNTGIHQSGTSDRIDFAINGATRLTLASTTLTVNINADFLASNVGLGFFKIENTSTGVTAPTYSFAGDIDTGMYAIAADTLGFSTGGVQRASVSASRWEFNTGASVSGTFFLSGISTATGTPDSLCRNGTEVTVNAALTCTVSARDQKMNISDFFTKPSGVLGGVQKDLSALDLVMALNPTQFAYKDHPERMRWGFIADEVQAVDPKLGDGYVDGEARSIDIAGILALNTKAIQELNAKVEAQDARIDALETRLAKLDGKEPPTGGTISPESKLSVWQYIWHWLISLFT